MFTLKIQKGALQQLPPRIITGKSKGKKRQQSKVRSYPIKFILLHDGTAAGAEAEEN